MLARLSDEEAELIKAFRLCSVTMQADLSAIAQTMARRCLEEKKTPFTRNVYLLLR